MAFSKGKQEMVKRLLSKRTNKEHFEHWPHKIHLFLQWKIESMWLRTSTEE